MGGARNPMSLARSPTGAPATHKDRFRRSLYVVSSATVNADGLIIDCR